MRVLSKSTQRTVFGTLSYWLSPVLLGGLRASNRLHVSGREHVDSLERTGENFILALWHGHMLPLLFAFWREGYHCFISPHRDGEYIARAVEALDHYVIRTSLRDRRVKSLVQALRVARRGGKMAITADGPLGPPFEVKPGVIQLAAKSKLPVVPIAGLASRAVFASSWDHFCVPLPLGEVHVRIGEPHWIPDENDLDRRREALEADMRQLTWSVVDAVPSIRRYRQFLPSPGADDRARPSVTP